MKGALEFMKIRTKFMSWICVILLLGGAWIGYSSYDSAVRQSTSDAAILADTIREAVSTRRRRPKPFFPESTRLSTS